MQYNGDDRYMRKVLIISYYFSDLTDVGAVRINGWAKFLPKFGWEPIIITATSKARPPEEFRLIEVPHDNYIAGLKKKFKIDDNKSLQEQLGSKSTKFGNSTIDLFSRLWTEIFAYPDIFSSWQKPVVKTVSRLLEEEHIDAMVSSSGPPTCNLAAQMIKRKHDLVWIADFRDLWTQNHYYPYTHIRHSFEEKLELRTLSYADSLTTISEPLANKLKCLHPDRKIHVIPNGFDPTQLNPGESLPEKFTITYTGSIYKSRQDPDILFEAISVLLSEGSLEAKNLSVEFYGKEEDWLLSKAMRYGLKDIVKTYGPISRAESIEKQRQSHLLLLLTWNDPKERGIYTAKIFDYLAARRPILSVGLPGSIVDDLLIETNTGAPPMNQEDLERFLRDAFLKYKSGKDIGYHGNWTEINRYSHMEMTRKLSNILNDVVKNPS